MNVHITGKQIPVSEALKQHAERRLASGAEKYFSDAVDAHVVFSRQAQRYRTDCSVHVGNGIRAHAHGEGDEPASSLEAACEKLEKRLRRYKRRLRDHRQKQHERQLRGLAAPSYVLAAEPEDAAGQMDEPAPEPTGLSPDIVDEGSVEIHELAVGEAVMWLDLQEQPVLLFRNERHGGINLVYRRPDGRIGWVDPGPDGR